VAATVLLSQASLGLLRVKRCLLRAWHVGLGLVLFSLTFVHAWLAMRVLPARFANAPGIWLATVAFLLLMVQLLLGITLIRPSVASRSLRAVHVTVGLGVVCLASIHVLLSR